jgi:BolA protein
MPLSSQDVQAALQAAFSPADIAVQDDSHLHAGHAGAREGRHFSVRVVSPQFVDLSRLARHRLVYDALSTLFPRGIHALAVEALTPAEAPDKPSAKSIEASPDAGRDLN